MQGDPPDNLVEQPIQIVSAYPPPPPRVARKQDPEHSSRDHQHANPHNAVPDTDTVDAAAHKEGKKKRDWGKPSWSDLFRVIGPPLQTYERDINRKQAQHEAAKQRRVQLRRDDESLQRERGRSGGVDWGGGGGVVIGGG
ncbi:hypothetical protein MMC26_004703 [Xylographa opegraphella]|nr:hypothetical protein [Xylographa opegraphella]